MGQPEVCRTFFRQGTQLEPGGRRFGCAYVTDGSMVRLMLSGCAVSRNGERSEGCAVFDAGGRGPTVRRQGV